MNRKSLGHISCLNSDVGKVNDVEPILSEMVSLAQAVLIFGQAHKVKIGSEILVRI